MTRRAAEIRLDALLRTACDVISERGLANTRTADVAQAAGVSQALVFYHFATKDRLLAQAFAYAVEQDLARLDAVMRSSAPPLTKLRRIVRLYTPTGRATSWAMWIDGWAESLRTPELEKVSRRLDLRWREDLATVISDGVREGTFECADPAGAAWRISAVVDGLAVQLAVHDRVISRRQFAEWVRLLTARELGLDPTQLD
ncbi:TetR family transcriptional regulator [Micromonospora peucetia]|uniref:TetR family transcriptional regulator n=1 Tax=Micromonospora peucetia TaxID=47871 RepID=A0ABZ1EH08_9ACTN|nr:TetR/AcrR family transcriptional regulator [Micromonospora peucetia]MCX4385841.1 TetR family transcriptional regulator [Micromonospora peucetia]WSA33222.1 TetR family transcriptional regulator [Micromonospora peucetia]